MNAETFGNESAPGERPASEADAKRGRESGLQLGTGESAPIRGCGWGAPGMAARSAAAPAALPCQNSNNSNQKTKRYRLTTVSNWVGVETWEWRAILDRA